MPEPKLVVLDFDGTLVSLGVDWPSVRGNLAAILTDLDLAPLTGVLATITDLDKRGEAQAARRCRAIVAAAEIEAAIVAPVNYALLQWLWDSVPCARLAVLTLNSRAAVLAPLAGLRLQSRLAREDVLGRGDVRPKPSPDGLLQLMKRHGVSPCDCVMVGDSEVDHACGRAAGIKTIDVSAIGCDWRDVDDVIGVES